MASYSDYLTYLRNADCKCKYSKGDKGDTGPTGPAGPAGSTGEGNLYEVQYKGVTDLSASSNFLFNSSTNTLKLIGSLDVSGSADISNNLTLYDKIIMENNIKIGDASSGQITQGSNAIAIGNKAGYNNQGSNSIAIGYQAGLNDQSDNTIILNASGSALNSDVENAFYINPIRNNSTDSAKNNTYTLFYNITNKEVIYDSTQTKSIIYFQDKTLNWSSGILTEELDYDATKTTNNGILNFFNISSGNVYFSDISNNSNYLLEVSFFCDASSTGGGDNTISVDLSGVYIEGSSLENVYIDTRTVARNDSVHISFGPTIYKFTSGQNLSIDFLNTYKPKVSVTSAFVISNLKLYLNAFKID